MKTNPFSRLGLVSSLAVALAACGGGSDGGSDSTAAASSSAWTTDVPASQRAQQSAALAAAQPKEVIDALTSDAVVKRHRRAATNSGSTGDASNATNSGTTNAGTTTTTTTDAPGTTTAADAASTPEAAPAPAEAPSAEAAPTPSAAPASAPTVTARASNDGSGPAGASAGSYGAVTFNEDWNGSLDESVWNTRMPHWTTPDLDNWKIENGLLSIWTPKDSDGRFMFNNRAMTTDGKYTQRYGWFEMEAKLPKGPSLWPSFWLYGIQGTKRPEIDIMESFGGVDEWWGDPNPIDYGATAWISDINDGSQRIGSVRPGHHGLANFDLTNDFHKFGAHWEPDGITFYFDGQAIGDKIYTSAFDMELFFIIGMGTGQYGDYNGPKSDTPTDSPFEVNYVRAWALPSGTTVNGKSVGQ